MSRKNRTPEENERRAKIRELLQMGGISSMDDIQNLFKETIAEFMASGLDAELDDELGLFSSKMYLSIFKILRIISSRIRHRFLAAACCYIVLPDFPSLAFALMRHQGQG